MNHRLLCSFVATLSLAACAPVEGDDLDAPEVSAEAYTGRAGDLRPTGLTATCVGGTITARGAITHGGALGVGASVAQVRFAVPSAAFVDVAVPALSEGASAPVVASRGGYAPGTYTVSLTADARGQVPEGSEANNVAPVTVTCPSVLPDLRIENVRAQCRNGVGFIYYDLVNHGSTAATSSRVRERDGTGLWGGSSHWSVNSNHNGVEHLVGGVPAFGRLPLYAAYGLPRPTGVFLTADSRDDVREGNELNNAATFTFRGCP